MELKQELKRSLSLSNNQNNLPDEAFRKLLDNAYAALLNKPEIHNMSTINSSKSDVVKEIYTALMTLILQLARHDCTTEQIDAMLCNELNFNSSRKELFCRMYGKQKERLQVALSMIGTHYPHIVDASWKMDYVIKTSSVDESSGPLYRIRLSTEVYDKGSESRRTEHVTFNCNTQQLQDLVYKLKDAVRHCERICND